MKPSLVHLYGVVVTISLAIVLLFTLIPYTAHAFFSPPLRGYSNLRLEPLYYLTGALIPVALWFVPALARRLATSAFKGHEYFFGRSGFYVRFPTLRLLRFRTTLLMSLGPFAIDMLAIVEIEHFFGNLTPTPTGRGFFVAPILLVLAGVITAMIPGAWLVNELGLRYLSPKSGEITRASSVYDGFLGPLSAVALLVSFITSLENASYSYEAATFVLGVWALRLFPPVLAAVTVYRMLVEPRVLPSLQTWCDSEGIAIKQNLAETLEAIRA